MAGTTSDAVLGVVDMGMVRLSVDHGSNHHLRNIIFDCRYDLVAYIPLI